MPAAQSTPNPPQYSNSPPPSIPISAYNGNPVAASDTNYFTIYMVAALVCALLGPVTEIIPCILYYTYKKEKILASTPSNYNDAFLYQSAALLMTIVMLCFCILSSAMITLETYGIGIVFFVCVIPYIITIIHLRRLAPTQYIAQPLLV